MNRITWEEWAVVAVVLLMIAYVVWDAPLWGVLEAL